MKRAFAGLACLLWATMGLAGVVIEVETRDFPGEHPTSVDTLYADGAMLRVEPGSGGFTENITILFRDDALIIVNDGEKTYSRLDEESIKAMSGQVNAAMKMLEEQMANMPAEQRAMMEKMMKGKMPSASNRPSIRLEQQGREKVGGHDCARYVIFEDDEKVSEVFAAPISSIDGADQAMQALRGMAEFGRKLVEAMPAAGQMAGLADGPFAMLDQIEGFPVLTRFYDGDEVIQEVELKSIVSRTLDSALFSPPAGYKETALLGPGL